MLVSYNGVQSQSRRGTRTHKNEELNNLFMGTVIHSFIHTFIHFFIRSRRGHIQKFSSRSPLAAPSRPLPTAGSLFTSRLARRLGTSEGPGVPSDSAHRPDVKRNVRVQRSAKRRREATKRTPREEVEAVAIDGTRPRYHQGVWAPRGGPSRRNCPVPLSIVHGDASFREHSPCRPRGRPPVGEGQRID